MRLLLVVAVGLLAIWVAFVATLWLFKPGDMNWSEAKRFVPDLLRLVRDLHGDHSLPRTIRVRLRVLLIYLALPVDLVPDFVPVLGYADDVIVVTLVLRSVARRAGDEAVTRHWRGSAAGLAMVRRLSGLASS